MTQKNGNKLDANVTTTEPENNHQQQILFDESDLLTKTDIDEQSKIAQQIIFDNEDNDSVIIDDAALTDLSSDELTMQQITNDTKLLVNSKPSWLWRVITSLFMLIVIIEATQFFINGFNQSPIITSIYAALFGALSMVSVRALWQEFVGLRQFKHQQDLKQQASTLLIDSSGAKQNVTEHIDISNAEVFCQKITNSLPCDLAYEQEHDVWREALSAGLSSKELVQLYSRIVLTKVDEKALNEVAKFSTEAVVLVALSPVAIIDMLVMLSRNLRMINKIAGLYGLKLGYWSRIKLIKQVFVNMAYAGASEIISDFGSDMLGAELLGKLSARFAQGLGAGMLTARLGIQTMQLCRPIPFDEKPKLNHIRKKISKQIKMLVNSGSK